MTPLDPFTLLLLLIGPFMGSFLALLADRLPRGEDVIRAPSACRACGHRLGLRDLVPILSYGLNRGQCRFCAAPVPPWLLYAEILAAGLAVIAVIVAPGPAQAWGMAGVLWLLMTLMLCDLLWLRLPDLLTGALALAALGLSAATGQPPLAMALLGGALGAGAFLGLRLAYRALRGRHGLGLGDVKLMVGCGALLGPHDLPLMVLIAALSALAVALAGGLQKPRALSGRRPLPFGAALAAATALLFVL